MTSQDQTREQAAGPEMASAGQHPGEAEPMPAGPPVQQEAERQPQPAAPDNQSQAAEGNQPQAAPPGNQASSTNGTALLSADELQGAITRWRDIQAEFVDEPRQAMEHADALVTDLMQRLTRTFADERQRLESHWGSGEGVSTEELRQGLQRYHSFFERLLAA